MIDDDSPRGQDRARGDFREAFARFEGSMTANLSNLAHDVKNLTQQLAAYATQRDLKVVEDRVGKLESNQTWLVRSVVGAIVTALMGLVVVVAKGAHP